MANGSYGTVRPADFDINEAEMFYSYAPDRNTPPSNFKEYDIRKALSKSSLDDGTNLDGMYNITLPADDFNKVGIYTLYIRPKRHKAKIQDIGTLSAYPNIRGLLIDTVSDATEIPSQNNQLIGWRIEYEQNGSKTNNLFRIITSNHTCETLISNDKTSKTYRLTDNSSLLFLTVTPSNASSVSSNTLPFIGNVGDTIYLSNTNFDPVMLEVEYTDNDIESLATLVGGTTSRSIEDGIITIYDKDKNIVKQYDTYQVKNSNDEPIVYIKEERDEIDSSKSLNVIKPNI